MPSSKLTALVAFDDANEVVEGLRAQTRDIELHAVTDPLQLPTTLERLQPNVVFSIKGPIFSAKHHKPIMDFPTVKWVEIGGSGYDHLHPWNRERLTVTNCAGILAPYLAETAMGALLTLNGNLLTYADQQRSRTWEQHQFRPLSEQTILIVGLGRIGQNLAKLAKAFGMRVLAIRRKQESHPAVDLLASPDELDHLLVQADVVSIHLRLRPDTKHLFDGRTLSKMKPNAILLNTSRGAIVQESDLIEALTSGHLRGAYLDVFEQEPLPIDSQLWNIPNVLITPHCSDNIHGWHLKFADHFAENLSRFVGGEKLHNLI
ncbi:MAG: D-2-hydroxyacid dehydrogenase [Aureliella sp.]